MGASSAAAGFGPLDWLAKAMEDLRCGMGDPRAQRGRWAEMGSRHGSGPGRGWGGGAWGHAGPGLGPWAPGQWSGNPWPFGPGRSRAGKGDVRSAILVLLAEGPRHGYQLIQDIVDRSDGAWRPSPGSVYPTLAALQDEGLVDDEKVEGRRVYALTPEGQAHVAARADELGRVFDGFGPPPERPDAGEPDSRGRGVEEYGRLLFGLGAAAVEVARNGTPEQVAAARRLLDATRRDLYRLLVDPSGGGASRESAAEPPTAQPGPAAETGSSADLGPAAGEDTGDEPADGRP